MQRTVSKRWIYKMFVRYISYEIVYVNPAIKLGVVWRNSSSELSKPATFYFNINSPISLAIQLAVVLFFLLLN